MAKNEIRSSRLVTYLYLYNFLTQDNLRQSVALFFMILVMAILDVIGVASVLPFIAVLSNPEIIHSNFLLKNFYVFLSFESQSQFLIFLGICSFTLLIVSLGFKGITTYFQARFALMTEYSIGKKLFQLYLNQPYPWFLNKNIANLNKIILSEVSAVVHGGILQFVTAVSQSIVILAMLIMLTFVNFTATIVISGGLGIIYILLFSLTKKFLERIGRKKVEANEARFVAVSEGLGAIKEIKAYSIESYFINRFSLGAKSYALNLSIAHSFSLIPRYILEAIAFGSLMLILLYNLAVGGDLVSLLPQITIYTLATYRLMPALHQVYGAVSQIKFHGPAISDLYDEINRNPTKEIKRVDDLTQKISTDITLENVGYIFPGSDKLVLDKINLKIKVGSKFAIIGKTGSGKSTLGHLLLGILEPTTGDIKVNGRRLIGKNLLKYKQLVGYVPQDIFILDDTILANIALGIDPEEVDFEMVKMASKSANLHEYVMTNSPNAYETVVGDRGIRLSGGERQRIGIARALYRQPKILILDEATSSLDSLTENAVMEAIDTLSNTDITIIVVAHRLNTVKACSDIILIDKGKIVDQGTFDYLADRNEIFSLDKK